MCKYFSAIYRQKYNLHFQPFIEWLLTFGQEAERNQWIELVTPNTQSENPEEKIYEDWDCPLIEAVTSIEAADNSNEVPMNKGDKANVLRKLSDSGTTYFFLKDPKKIKEIF